MLKKSTSWCVLIYGLLIAGLGYYGYHEKGSMMSLYSGVGSGAVLIISSILMFASHRWASYLALTITFLLTALFSFRYSMTNNGLLATLSVLSATMLIFLLAQTTKWKR
ncbi:MAG TPA: TMEM14 family protein [Chlamydiales bacterium]|nr:TMEM14 family protein [Chlamydiales bacterium]